MTELRDREAPHRPDLRSDPSGPADPTRLVRRARLALLALAGAATVGTAVELAMLRHWNGFDQLIPWAILGIVALGTGALALRPNGGTILAARVVGVASGLGGLYGAWVHVRSNYDAGPLDFRYAEKWASMSAGSRWWTAASGGVGPSPALAPMALAMAGACLAAATLTFDRSSSD